MNTTRPTHSTDRFAVIAMLAALLQRLEASKVAIDAGQYRTVVQRLSQALADAPSDARLHALLDAHPAAAELYENLRYEHAGLCRAPLERSMTTEARAREAIERAAGKGPQATRAG